MLDTFKTAGQDDAPGGTSSVRVLHVAAKFWDPTRCDPHRDCMGVGTPKPIRTGSQLGRRLPSPPYDGENLRALTEEAALALLGVTRRKTMTDFYDDVANGTLPKYSFIKPRMFFDHNDMHPTAPANFENDEYEQEVSYVTAADKLMGEVYAAIRASSSAIGSNAQNTLLIITWDENGGLHDHVPPPAAIAPTSYKALGSLDTWIEDCHNAYGFEFNRLGVRISTIMVSTFIEPNTIVNELRHTEVAGGTTRIRASRSSPRRARAKRSATAVSPRGRRSS